MQKPTIPVLQRERYWRIKKGLDNVNTQNDEPCTHSYLSRKLPSLFHMLFSSQTAKQTFCPSKDGLIPWSFSFCNLVDWRTWLSKASSEMISLVVNSKGFSIQHKWSISVHCLEFKKTPSAALSLMCVDFFLYLSSPSMGKARLPTYRMTVFSVCERFVWLTKVGGNCHVSKILKEFWQMARTSSKETGKEGRISKFIEKAKIR